MQLTADFLPGQLILERGVAADYRRLAYFHYAPGPPATWADVWRAVYRDSETSHSRTRVIGPRSRGHRFSCRRAAHP